MVTRMFTLRPLDFPVFDGSDPTLSFADFIRSIDVTLDMAHERASDVLPTFLYGDALRFYETLDPECQHDWCKLTGAMKRRYPGKQGVIDTPADGPPSATTPKPTPSPSEVALTGQGKTKTSAKGDLAEKGLKHKKSDVWLGKLKDKLRLPSFARS